MHVVQLGCLFVEETSGIDMDGEYIAKAKMCVHEPSSCAHYFLFGDLEDVLCGFCYCFAQCAVLRGAWEELWPLLTDRSEFLLASFFFFRYCSRNVESRNRDPDNEHEPLNVCTVISNTTV